MPSATTSSATRSSVLTAPRFRPNGSPSIASGKRSVTSTVTRLVWSRATPYPPQPDPAHLTQPTPSSRTQGRPGARLLHIYGSRGLQRQLWRPQRQLVRRHQPERAGVLPGPARRRHLRGEHLLHLPQGMARGPDQLSPLRQSRGLQQPFARPGALVVGDRTLARPPRHYFLPVLVTPSSTASTGPVGPVRKLDPFDPTDARPGVEGTGRQRRRERRVWTGGLVLNIHAHETQPEPEPEPEPGPEPEPEPDPEPEPRTPTRRAMHARSSRPTRITLKRRLSRGGASCLGPRLERDYPAARSVSEP